jgi:hypothetical protein
VNQALRPRRLIELRTGVMIWIDVVGANPLVSAVDDVTLKFLEGGRGSSVPETSGSLPAWVTLWRRHLSASQDLPSDQSERGKRQKKKSEGQMNRLQKCKRTSTPSRCEGPMRCREGMPFSRSCSADGKYIASEAQNNCSALRSSKVE